MALTTKAIIPTGGKTSPIATIIIDMTPNQMGSNPRRGDQRKGELQGEQQQRDLVHEHADDEIGDDDADDDDPAVEVHRDDHGNHLLGHPAQGHVVAEDRRADEDHEDHGAGSDRLFRASKAPAKVRRPKAAPMTAASKAPMAPTSVGVTMPV